MGETQSSDLSGVPPFLFSTPKTRSTSKWECGEGDFCAILDRNYKLEVANPSSASPKRGFCKRGALLLWFHDRMRWAGASDTRSMSGSVLLDSEKRAQKVKRCDEATKRWIFIIFIASWSQSPFKATPPPFWVPDVLRGSRRLTLSRGVLSFFSYNRSNPAKGGGGRYHPFRNQYLSNSKTIKSCNFNCREFSRIPEGNYFL